MKLKYLEIGRNAETNFVTIGRFAGPFYLGIVRSRRRLTFRWHVHLRIGRETFSPIVERRGLVRTWVLP